MSTAAASTSKLFHPIKVGTMTLQHRIVLSPLTRNRATRKTHIPIVPLVKTYYKQRSTRPGTLLITEATLIHPRAAGMPSAPGIWSPEQIAAWKEITTAVHANGSFIFAQLPSLGRAAEKALLDAESLPYIAPSPIPLSGRSDTPRELTIAEIKEFVQLFVQAAKNAVFEAGFDGVEMHGANGYMIHQFLEDGSNQRTDEYGGSVKNRSRLALEIVDAVAEAVGEERTAIRLSPWNEYQDMKMADPIPQYTHLVSALKETHPSLAYLHVVEPRFAEDPSTRVNIPAESNDFIRDIWSPRPLISAGGYDRASAMKTADEKGGLIAFGRHFLSNPDLPERLEKDLPLNVYDRSTFYTHGDQPGSDKGYIDYPFVPESREKAEVVLP